MRFRATSSRRSAHAYTSFTCFRCSPIWFGAISIFVRAARYWSRFSRVAPRLRREGGVMAGLGAAGELLEAAADAGEFAQKRLGGGAGSGLRPGAERGLADEAGRGHARVAGVFRDLPELLGVEANQLR